MRIQNNSTVGLHGAFWWYGLTFWRSRNFWTKLSCGFNNQGGYSRTSFFYRKKQKQEKKNQFRSHSHINSFFPLHNLSHYWWNVSRRKQDSQEFDMEIRHSQRKSATFPQVKFYFCTSMSMRTHMAAENPKSCLMFTFSNITQLPYVPKKLQSDFPHQ